MKTMFNGKGNMVEGRIERIRVQNEDGSFAMDRKCDIHNHIVDSGLDGIMSVGAFTTCSEATAIDHVKRYYLLSLNKVGTGQNDNTPDNYVRSNYAIYGRDNPLLPADYEQQYGLEENKLPTDIHVGDTINSKLMTSVWDGSRMQKQFQYDGGLWVRMTYYLAIGTGDSDTMDYTDSLDNIYTPDGGDPYSSSHYLPSSAQFDVRGTTPEAAGQGDIHSTHRLTSNSVKATESVDIKEVGYFMAISEDYNNNVAWGSRSWSRGPLFSRIKLDTPVHLEAGQRMVITYAITEYAPYTGGIANDSNEYEIIYDLGLVDEAGNPMQVMGEDGNMHILGAIGRIVMCDGDCRTSWSMNASNPGANMRSEGAFHSIHPTADYGLMPAACGIQPRYSSNGYSSITSPYWYCSGYDTDYIGPKYGRGSSGYYACNSVSQTFVCNSKIYAASDKCCTDGVVRGEGYYNNDSDVNKRHYQTGKDAFNGFPLIGGGARCSTLEQPWYNYDYYASMFLPVGRSATMYSNPVPGGNIRRYREWDSNDLTAEYIAPYKKGSFCRDFVIEIPCYYGGIYSSNNISPANADPSTTVNIYWILIRNRMMYKIGYFETPGNVDTFVQCGIPKKAGQVLRIRYREGIQRKLAQ